MACQIAKRERMPELSKNKALASDGQMSILWAKLQS